MSGILWKTQCIGEFLNLNVNVSCGGKTIHNAVAKANNDII